MSSSDNEAQARPALDEDAARARIEGSAAFAASAQAWRDGVAALDLPNDPPPAEGLWARIEARLDRVDPTPPTLTVRADHGVWETLFDGVERRRLYVDPVQGWEATLIRLAPGSLYPAHDHNGLEECLVLEGEFEFGEMTVRQGDLHLAFPGTDHPEIFSPKGALLYIRAPLAA